MASFELHGATASPTDMRIPLHQKGDFDCEDDTLKRRQPAGQSCRQQASVWGSIALAFATFVLVGFFILGPFFQHAMVDSEGSSSRHGQSLGKFALAAPALARSPFRTRPAVDAFAKPAQMTTASKDLQDRGSDSAAMTDISKLLAAEPDATPSSTGLSWLAYTMGLSFAGLAAAAYKWRPVASPQLSMQPNGTCIASSVYQNPSHLENSAKHLLQKLQRSGDIRMSVADDGRESMIVTPQAMAEAIAATSAAATTSRGGDTAMTATLDVPDMKTFSQVSGQITEENPLRVIIAGAGVGGLALASSLCQDPRMDVKVLEKTDEFKRFGGPIQLASNALEVIKDMEPAVFNQVMEKFTFTGDKENGIKDGIRDEWYSKFDLATPAEERNMPYTGVIERPDLQEIYLKALPKGVVQNGDGVESYTTNKDGHGVKAVLESGKVLEGDVIVGADGIWSAVRATMRDEPARGEGSGVSYSGYTVFAGELNYDSFDNGQVGYKVYIGPGQYFVITDIGKGRYQWYAFLARAPGSAETTEMPDGQVPYLKGIFDVWSKDIHHILDATKEDEIAQRDLYDRPPSAMKSWSSEGRVTLLGDSIHAMMPNLGQGGCQAIEDAFVIAQELKAAKSRDEIDGKLQSYESRRKIRSASVQGLSRFASDIIIKGFDTPAKIVLDGGLKFENFGYAGIVTKMLQPILPIFFNVQFNFLYSGWRNETAIDAKAALGFLVLGGSILLVAGNIVALPEEALIGTATGVEALTGGEGLSAIGGFLEEIVDKIPF